MLHKCGKSFSHIYKAYKFHKDSQWHCADLCAPVGVFNRVFEMGVVFLLGELIETNYFGW